MLRGRRMKAWGLVAAGVALGLAVGGGLAVGVLLGQRSPAVASLPGFGDLHLKASASHGNDSFAIATGPIDEDVEGLFMLDCLTGDVMCLVLNPKGGIAGQFKSNVYAQGGFSAKKGKKGNFLIATGSMNGTVTPAGRLAGCVCYVVDSSAGEVMAFGLPWNKALTNSGQIQGPNMGVIGKWQVRSVAIP